MSDDRDDLPDIPQHLQHLNNLPPEILERVLSGEAVIGDPDEGLRILALARAGEGEFKDFLEAFTDTGEIQEAMAHVHTLAMNIQGIILLMQSKWFAMVIEAEAPDWATDMPGEWAPDEDDEELEL